DRPAACAGRQRRAGQSAETPAGPALRYARDWPRDGRGRRHRRTCRHCSRSGRNDGGRAGTHDRRGRPRRAVRAGRWKNPLMALDRQPVLHIVLLAGEESGDRLGGALMRALKARHPGAIAFSGVGGGHMAAEGLVSLFPISELAIMGFAMLPAKLAQVFRRIRQTADAVVASQPDVLVIIDSPDFTHRVARRVRKRAPQIPIVDYVSPTVWAWRAGRSRAMRDYVDQVLCLLPFEPAVHRRLGGPPASFVGHPLGERAGILRPNAEEARRREASPPILLVMPGSRKIEIDHMLPIFARSVELIAERVKPLEVVIPAVPHLAPRLATAIA